MEIIKKYGIIIENNAISERKFTKKYSVKKIKKYNSKKYHKNLYKKNLDDKYSFLNMENKQFTDDSDKFIHMFYYNYADYYNNADYYDDEFNKFYWF